MDASESIPGRIRASPAGQLVARMLARAWRQLPPEPELSVSELEEIAPRLLSSGAAGLAWWRLRHSALRAGKTAQQLHQAYRLHTLQAALHQQEIERVFALLRSAGVEPILVKGWAIARYYPEQGLRPYGDLDLCVHPQQYQTAQELLKSSATGECDVDLHRGFDKLDDRSWDELYARSQLIKLGGTEVRVLGPEDHLRLLAVHLLRHGAWRPLWLCDVAVAVESRPATFDWQLCLGSQRRRADWVACAIGLAHQLLGAEIAHTPVESRAKQLPSWLVPAVVRQWHWCLRPGQRPLVLQALLAHLRRPAGLLEELYFRWDKPIEATICLKGSFNELPRAPFQLVYLLLRSPELPRQLVKWLRR